jgi:hypothetical protein
MRFCICRLLHAPATRLSNVFSARVFLSRLSNSEARQLHAETRGNVSLQYADVMRAARAEKASESRSPFFGTQPEADREGSLEHSFYIRKLSGQFLGGSPSSLVLTGPGRRRARTSLCAAEAPVCPTHSALAVATAAGLQLLPLPVRVPSSPAAAAPPQSHGPAGAPLLAVVFARACQWLLKARIRVQLRVCIRLMMPGPGPPRLRACS